MLGMYWGLPLKNLILMNILLLIILVMKKNQITMIIRLLIMLWFQNCVKLNNLIINQFKMMIKYMKMQLRKSIYNEMNMKK